MSFFYRMFINARMERKLAIVFIIFIILPISIIGYISYSYYPKVLVDNTRTYVVQIGTGIVSQIEYDVKGMSDLSKMPLYIRELQDLLEQGDNALDVNRKISFYLQFMSEIKNSDSIYLFSNTKGRYYEHTRFSGARNDLNENYEKWKQIAEESSGSATLLRPKRVSDGQNNRYVYSVVRRLTSAYTDKPIGFILVDAGMGLIAGKIEELNKTTKGNALLIDDQGYVIYAVDENIIGTNIREDNRTRPALEHGLENYMTEWNGEPSLCVSVSSPQTGWKLLTFVPQNVMMKKANEIRYNTVLSIAIVIMTALSISILVSRALTIPLRKIVGLMKNVQKGMLDVRYPVTSSDEVGIVGAQFNKMLERIQALITENYEITLHKKDVEMRVLQSQINPHFMYNTLETIRLTAELNDDHKVSEMSYLLGKLLRYSISHSMETVTLQQEIQYLETYMALQNYRFSGRFRLELDIPEEWNDLRCPKLMLQPIAENAIYHGLEGVRGTGIIAIHIESNPESVYIHIADNGIGMSVSQLEGLINQMESAAIKTTNDRGIGLRNVYERIKLHYGNKSELLIHSEQGQGTCITIRLPLRQEMEADVIDHNR
ncbi:sensor histidine kinase [Paenibacillus sp. KQZ6P-2]|uniref:histidine kinase n=1 Tax=Paenibacillus mangrovi TaxID=2931978 RepID=A0A9X1WRU7_9BACL|nr:sensor histidine kinase [Paenibacillus mangrovi]MCJ8013491.1 sensor histidine kinase [Paenibacillus mangrovi]